MVDFGMDPNHEFKDYLFEFLTDINYDDIIDDDDNDNDDTTQQKLKPENYTRAPKIKKTKQLKKPGGKRLITDDALNNAEIKTKKDEFNDVFTESSRKLLMKFNDGTISGKVFVDDDGNVRTLDTENLGTLVFPASLNSFQRMKIHEIADDIKGLIHQSIGEGNERYIEIKKQQQSKNSVDENPNITKESENRSSDDNHIKTLEKSKSKNKKNQLKSEVPINNNTISASKSAGLAALKRFNIIVTDNDDNHHDNEKDNDTQKGSEVIIQESVQSIAQKQSKTKKVAEQIDEDDFLNAAILANQAHKDFYQYRIGSTAMPNPVLLIITNYFLNYYNNFTIGQVKS
jgi:hypothetical protein